MKAAWKSPGAAAAIIILLTFVAYIPALHGGFVWDDNQLITDNRLVRARDGLYRFWFTTEAADYYPLTWSLWWLEWRTWGDHATGYHVVNVLLHAANAVLVWTILRSLRIPAAWLAALVFAVHPVNVATVAWISEQKNTLSMFFFALAILFYLRFDEQNQRKWYCFSLAAFLLALLSKSAVVMLPVVLLGCVWWRHGTVRRKDLLCVVPFFVLSLILGMVTVWFQYHRVLQGNTVRADGCLDRLAAAGCVPWFYLYKALWPVNLSAVYPRWGRVSYLPGIVLIAGLALSWWNRKTSGRPVFFALGYFVIMLFPVLGFFDQDFYQYSFVADPWQYYSIIGVIALVIAAISQHKYSGIVAGAAVLMLSAATWERSSVYASEETLWRDTVRKNPTSWMPYYNLGTTLLHAGRLEEAIKQFEQAARIRPDDAKVHSNLGIVLAQSGRVGDAVAQFEQALQIDSNLFEVHANLGHALMILGNMPEAIAHWEQALRIKPDSAEVHYDLGAAFEQTGKTQKAIEHYEFALRFNPDYDQARQALARLQTHGTSGQR